VKQLKGDRKMRKLFTLLSLSFLFCGFASAGTLTVIHGIPGDSIGLDRELEVDVYVNDGYAFSFSFTESVDNLDLPAGDYTFEVYLAGTDPSGADPVLSLSAMIPESGNFTAIAHLTYTGDSGAPGIALSAFQNETSPISSRPPLARMTVRHTANAPEVAVEVRRLWFWPHVVFPGFSNADGEGPEERVFDLLRGSVFVNLLAGGQKVFSTGRVSLQQGDNIVAYAIGDFFTDSFQLFVQVID
jgi:hypothetical protein